MRVRVLSLLAVSVFLLSACGDGGGSISKSSSSSSSAEFDPELCADFDESDGPSDRLLAGLPAEHRATAEAIQEFGRTLDGMAENDDSSIDALIDISTRKGLGDDLRAFAQFAEDRCGTTEGGTASAQLAVLVDMASAEQVDDYCTALTDQLSDPDGGPALLGGLVDIAPESHVEPLEQLAQLDPDDPSAAASEELFGPLLGLGIYAEATCGAEGALAEVLLGLMFMGLDDGSASGDGGDGSIPDIDPTQYPDIVADAANAALPADAGLSFTVATVDLEDDGEYLASMVVPDGWDYETGFNVEFAPAGDGGFFTSVEAGAGCDGGCSATDWETRLREEGGKIASFLSNYPGAVEAAVTGSAGAAFTDTSDGGRALVVRWDDRADKYFSCEVRLEDELASLLPAFVTACAASRPAWFPVE